MKESDGFTLLEVVLVIFILGIVTTVALTRIPSIDRYNEIVESDTLKSHLRYAQNRAMNTNLDWGIDFLSSSQYRLFGSIDEAGTQYRYFPGSESAVNVTLTVLRMQANQVVKFDEMGSPGAADISIKKNSGDELFSITSETGFIE